MGTKSVRLVVSVLPILTLLAAACSGTPQSAAQPAPSTPETPSGPVQAPQTLSTRPTVPATDPFRVAPPTIALGAANTPLPTPTATPMPTATAPGVGTIQSNPTPSSQALTNVARIPPTSILTLTATPMPASMAMLTPTPTAVPMPIPRAEVPVAMALKVHDSKGNDIATLEQWSESVRSSHWRPGRSAYSLADFIMDRNGAAHLESRISSVLSRPVRLERGTPEYAARFDRYRGPARLDIGISGRAVSGESLFVGVEAKVDESFGSETVCERYRDALQTLSGNPRSKAAERVTGLLSRYFADTDEPCESRFAGVGYQLLTATAGTVSAPAAGHRRWTPRRYRPSWTSWPTTTATSERRTFKVSRVTIGQSGTGLTAAKIRLTQLE